MSKADQGSGLPPETTFDDNVDEAWAAEIARRMEDYRAGRVNTVSWDELRAHLHRANR